MLMKKILIVLLLFITLNINAQTVIQTYTINHIVLKITDEDIHYHSSVVLSGFGASTFYYFIDKPLVASLVGAGFATTIGAIKELWWDGYLGNGVPSINDFMFDFSGAHVPIIYFNLSVNLNQTSKKRKLKNNEL